MIWCGLVVGEISIREVSITSSRTSDGQEWQDHQRVARPQDYQRVTTSFQACVGVGKVYLAGGICGDASTHPTSKSKGVLHRVALYTLDSLHNGSGIISHI